MLRYNTIEDSYWAPKRGDPPKCPDGYVNDEINPFKCVPDMKPCQYRQLETYKYAPCGCMKQRVHCNGMARKVTINMCYQCEVKGPEAIANAIGATWLPL